MIYEGFKIHSTEHIDEAYCECGKTLLEVSNGFLSRALYCPQCENVYVLKKVKVPAKKVTEEFLNQCRIESEFQDRKHELYQEIESKIKKTKRNRN